MKPLPDLGWGAMIDGTIGTFLDQLKKNKKALHILFLRPAQMGLKYTYKVSGIFQIQHVNFFPFS